MSQSSAPTPQAPDPVAFDARAHRLSDFARSTGMEYERVIRESHLPE